MKILRQFLEFQVYRLQFVVHTHIQTRIFCVCVRKTYYYKYQLILLFLN